MARSLFFHFTQVIRQAGIGYIARFLVTFRCIPVYLEQVYYAQDNYCDMAVLHVLGRQLVFEMPVAELARNRALMMRLHPLEYELIQGINQELSYKEGQNLSNKSLDLEKFACIEKQFYCPWRSKFMVIISTPQGDHQKCLSLKEFINQQKLLILMKSLSSYGCRAISAKWLHLSLC